MNKKRLLLLCSTIAIIGMIMIYFGAINFIRIYDLSGIKDGYSIFCVIIGSLLTLFGFMLSISHEPKEHSNEIENPEERYKE